MIVEYIVKVQKFNGKLGWRTVVMCNETLKFYKNKDVYFMNERSAIDDALNTLDEFHREVEDVAGKQERYVRLELH